MGEKQIYSKIHAHSLFNQTNYLRKIVNEFLSVDNPAILSGHAFFTSFVLYSVIVLLNYKKFLENLYWWERAC